jgi:hypothetical protein
VLDHGSGSYEFHIHLEWGEGNAQLMDTLNFGLEVALDTVVDEGDEAS